MRQWLRFRYGLGGVLLAGFAVRLERVHEALTASGECPPAERPLAIVGGPASLALPVSGELRSRGWRVVLAPDVPAAELAERIV